MPIKLVAASSCKYQSMVFTLCYSFHESIWLMCNKSKRVHVIGLVSQKVNCRFSSLDSTVVNYHGFLKFCILIICKDFIDETIH